MKALDLSFTLVFWGLWAFFPKLAQKQLGDAYSGIVFQREDHADPLPELEPLPQREPPGLPPARSGC